MPDYGLYKLSNSTEVPRYPGSIVPELIKVAGVQQEKYDASVYSDELLQQALDTSQVREADMPVYKALYDEMAARMKERAAKGDYENMVRETNRDARTFAQRFAPIAENRKREQAYQEELDKMIASGKVTRAKADEAKRYSKFFDKGLTYDPATGQYKGQFSGYIPGEDVDLSDFVHKALQGINPKVFGSDVRYDNGKFYRQVGGKSTVLTMDELWPHVEAYAKTDPKFQSYLQEQQMFKSYRFADEERLRKNLDPMDYDRLRQEANTLGMSVGEMLQTKASTGATKDIYDTLYNLTSKYQRDDKESWDKNMGENEAMGAARAAAAKPQPTNFGFTYVDRDNAGNITNVRQFEEQQKQVQSNLAAVDTEWTNFLKEAKVETDKNGVTRFYSKDGKQDLTAQGTALMENRKYLAKQQEGMQATYDSVKAETGFDFKRDITPKDIEKAANSLGFNLATLSLAPQSIWDLAVKTGQRMTGNVFGAIATEHFNGDARKQELMEKLHTQLMSTNTRYKDFNKKLLDRVNGTSELNQAIAITDDQARKDLSTILTSMAGGEGIGAEQGMISFRVGSGKNAGTQLEASKYDLLHGEFTPVAIGHDNATGELQLIVRANRDVQGKKIKGENLILRATNITGLEDYLKKALPPADYSKFVLSGELKSRLNPETNKTGTTTFELQTPTGSVVTPTIIKTHSGGTAKYRLEIPYMKDGVEGKKVFNNFDQQQVINTLSALTNGTQ